MKTNGKAVGDAQVAAFEREIQIDWRRFIRGGFEYDDLSDLLFATLALNSGFEAINQQDRRDFWGYYFASDTDRLERFWAYFAGQLDTRSGWMETGLGQLVAADLAAILPVLRRTLASLHEYMYQTEKWNLLIEKQAYLSTSPEKLIRWSRRYDEDQRFQTYEQWLEITPEVRRFLKIAVQAYQNKEVQGRQVTLVEIFRQGTTEYRTRLLHPPIYSSGMVNRPQTDSQQDQLELSPKKRQTTGRTRRKSSPKQGGLHHAATD
jgi:hypothetical protein